METFTVHEHTLWRVRTLEACFLRRQNLDVSSVDTAEHKRVLLVVLIELGCLWDLVTLSVGPVDVAEEEKKVKRTLLINIY